jgi:hypothetical protein
MAKTLIAAQHVKEFVCITGELGSLRFCVVTTKGTTFPPRTARVRLEEKQLRPDALARLHETYLQSKDTIPCAT